MLNIDEINETILGLENNAPTTFDTCMKLSALYNVRDRLSNAIQSVPDSLESELNDVLPQYKKYREIKRQYQMGKTTETDVTKAIQAVCKEILEFLLVLYRNTDTAFEREQILTMLNNVRNAL